MTNVNQTASDNAEEFGFHAGDLVQEWLWDDDVDDSIRAKIVRSWSTRIMTPQSTV